MASRRPLHVVVAGDGPAAAETLLALDEHAGTRVRLTLVAPEPGATFHGVSEPFSARHAHRSSVRALAGNVRAAVFGGRVAEVDAADHRLLLGDGRSLRYDALVLAVGARPRVAYDRALTFFGKAGAIALNRLVGDVDEGRTRSLAFVVPPGPTWPVPLYELAIQAGGELRGRAVGMRLLTPERAPLAMFGPQSQRAVAQLLDDAGVAFTGDTEVVDPPLDVDCVVALPILEGPAVPGVPHAPGGFLPTDRFGAVLGAPDVYAAGDATWFPVKQLDVALAQAAAVATTIAARAGAYVTPVARKPVVRAHLLAGGGRTLLLQRVGDDAEPPPGDAPGTPSRLDSWLRDIAPCASPKHSET
jgi:sulfide:quinone oxidoreductase